MSARQPFVPQQPASNQSDPKTKNTDMNPSTNTNAALKKSQQNPSDLGTNKPLNLSGLIKPRSSHKQQNDHASRTGPGTPTLKSRGSFDGIQRPMKPAVFSKNQGSIRSRMSNNLTEKNPAQNESLSNAQNLQASPFFPSSNSTPTSGFLTNAAVAFKDPGSFQLNSSACSSEKDTHIPTLAQGPFGSTRTMATNTSQLRSTLDNIPESIGEDSASPFTNGTRAEERQRIRTNLSHSVDLGEPPSSPLAPADSAPALGLGFGVAVSGGDASLGLGIAVSTHLGSGSESIRTKRKRNRAEDEDQEEEEGADGGMEYGKAAMKRWRGDDGQIEYMPTSHSTPGTIPTSTSSSSTKKKHQQQNRHQHYYREPSAQIQDVDADQHDQEYEEMTSRHLTSRQQTPASTHSRASNEQPQAQGHALLTLLGTDLDVYVAQHMEEYEAEKVKWATCDIDEWFNRANELAAGYASLLDFVKDHMTTKFAIYATLNRRVKDHESVVDDREKVLEEVQKGLVKDGGVLI